MKRFCLNGVSNKKLCNLLLLLLTFPHGVLSIISGYYLSFVTREVELLRLTSNVPTAIIEQQSPSLCVLFTLSIFTCGYLLIKTICECIYRILPEKNITQNTFDIST